MEDKNKNTDQAKKDNFPGYPHYPASEDIYNMEHKESDINPEDLGKKKEILEIHTVEKPNEKSFKEDVSGSDLDVPGAELDDIQESAGSGDEENDYFSLGGDNHNDLEEDKG